jgi:hypothetical protein
VLAHGVRGVLALPYAVCSMTWDATVRVAGAIRAAMGMQGGLGMLRNADAVHVCRMRAGKWKTMNLSNDYGSTGAVQALL